MKASLSCGKVPAFFIFLLMVNLSSVRSASDDIRVEGIVMDDKNPEQSMAVLNGQLLKKGDHIGNYEILKVDAQSVHLRDLQTQQEKILPVSAKSEMKAEEGKNPSAAVPPSQKPSNNTLLSDLAAKIKKVAQEPQKAVNRLWELRGLRNLAVINNAAVSFYNQKKIFPLDFNQLIKANLLPESYAGGVKENFRFYFFRPPNPADFGIHADPLDADQGLRYFYIGTDAVIRESHGKPADSKSPPHEY